MKAIIFAAGKGTRLQPLTETTPKTLLKISGEQTVLDIILNSLPAEIDEVYIVVSHLGDRVENFVEQRNNKQEIVIVPQIPDQKGTMAALLSAKDFISPGERFLVLNGDDLHSPEELQFFIKEKESNLFGVQKTIMPGYYATEIDENNFIKGFREQTEEEIKNGALITTGLYLLDSRVFDFAPVGILGSEIGLPQTIVKNIENYPVKAVEITGWRSINTHEDLEKVRTNHNKK